MSRSEIIHLEFIQEELGTTGDNGYWYAHTIDNGYDASGQTPLEAVTKLAAELASMIRSLKVVG